MLVANTTQTIEESLEQTLNRRIGLRTMGRIRALQVKLSATGVVVHGSSPSYYVKQLVLAAVRELLPAISVDLDIEVLDNFSRAPEGRRRFPNTAHWWQDPVSLEPGANSDENLN